MKMFLEYEYVSLLIKNLFQVYTFDLVMWNAFLT